MKAVNYSELRENLKANLDSVTDNEELLVVHRPKGKSIVMMTLDEYNSLQETQHLLQSKSNRDRLEKAVGNINAKRNLMKQTLVEEQPWIYFGINQPGKIISIGLKTDKKVLRKLNSLIKECQRTPFEGTGKPEALRQNLSGFWSRRITGEHRLVYKVDNDVLFIAQRTLPDSRMLEKVGKRWI
jgi:Txe/YoeB family toxin of toxin-antitoxin system